MQSSLVFVCSIRLLYEKRKELCDARDKLTNGLGKIEEAKVQVTQMSVELEKKRTLANDAQKKCEESLGGLVNEQREVEQSKATVEKLKERVKIDEEKASLIAQAAQEDLAAAMPALEAANIALESLSRKSITEVKSYGRPPVLVEKALEAVMILRNSEASWAEAKRQLSTCINKGPFPNAGTDVLSLQATRISSISSSPSTRTTFPIRSS